MEGSLIREEGGARVSAPHGIPTSSKVELGSSAPERVEASPRDSALGPAPAESSSRANAGGPRVLVAEDSPVNRMLALAQLRRLGYRADAVSDGKEVITALGSAAYDLVLMDCHMPRMDGFQASRWIRRDARFQHLRIVAVTGSLAPEDRAQCRAAGMDDCVGKPITLEDLQAVLDRNLSPSYSRQANSPVSTPQS